MKIIVALLTALLIIASASFAYAVECEDLSIDELWKLRDEILEDLTAVNNEIVRKMHIEASVGVSLPAKEDELSLGKIKDLFPDKAFAKYIRDLLGKISIEQSVTQAELDTIEEVWINQMNGPGYGEFTSFNGIGYLRNLEVFGFFATADSLGTQMPEEFYTLTNLTEVHFPESITTLSESLGNLTKLTELDMYLGSATSLPESIGNLVNLKVLNMNCTEITSLPESVGNLINLEKLYVFSTQLESLPNSIGNLVNLKELDMYNTKITSLPDSIGNLANLESLELHYTELAELPSSIGNLTKLESLNLNNTKISELPDSIGNLTNLKTLAISDTNITKLPDSIWNLQLEKIYMRGLPIE